MMGLDDHSCKVQTFDVTLKQLGNCKLMILLWTALLSHHVGNGIIHYSQPLRS